VLAKCRGDYAPVYTLRSMHTGRQVVAALWSKFVTATRKGFAVTRKLFAVARKRFAVARKPFTV